MLVDSLNSTLSQPLFPLVITTKLFKPIDLLFKVRRGTPRSLIICANTLGDGFSNVGFICLLFGLVVMEVPSASSFHFSRPDAFMPHIKSVWICLEIVPIRKQLRSRSSQNPSSSSPPHHPLYLLH